MPQMSDCQGRIAEHADRLQNPSRSCQLAVQRCSRPSALSALRPVAQPSRQSLRLDDCLGACTRPTPSTATAPPARSRPASSSPSRDRPPQVALPPLGKGSACTHSGQGEDDRGRGGVRRAAHLAPILTRWCNSPSRCCACTALSVIAPRPVGCLLARRPTCCSPTSGCPTAAASIGSARPLRATQRRTVFGDENAGTPHRPRPTLSSRRTMHRGAAAEYC